MEKEEEAREEAARREQEAREEQECKDNLFDIWSESWKRASLRSILLTTRVIIQIDLCFNFRIVICIFIFIFVS